MIDKVARDGDLAAGDTFLFNDPYDGGTHLNDFRLVRPLMRDGKVFAWLASVGHWLDVGGNVPGNFNAKATESFQEGFRIPPVKLVRAGVLQQDIIDILAANSRVPQSNWGDLNGQLNALDLGERRLHALLDEYGDETIAAALAALSARAETLMRANIAALPDGTYCYDDFLDNDGVTDTPLRIALDLTIAGDRMRLDFSRSAPPCDGPLNIARSTTRRVLLCRAQASLHRRARQCRLPRADRIRHSRHDAARRLGAAPGRRLYRNHPARHRRDLRRLRQGGARARQRQPVRHHQCAVARRLARRTAGAGSCSASSAAGSAAIRRATASITATTRSRPRPSRRSKSWNRSIPSCSRNGRCGRTPAVPGRHRGGLGAIYEIEALAEDGADVFLIGERGKYPPFGVNGGKPAALNRFVYETDRGEATPPLVSKITDVKIRRGQKVRLETPGGGGFGDPATREPERVVRDVRLGYVSREAARRDYKVVLRDDGSLDADGHRAGARRTSA